MEDKALLLLLPVAFIGGWVAFAIWARKAKNYSWTIALGGGFVATCSALALVGALLMPDKPDLSASVSSVDGAPASVGASTENEPFQIKPEQLVRFPKSNIACLTTEALQKAMEYGIKGEETKMKAMFLSQETPDGLCITLSPEKTYKVISATYNNPSAPEAGLLEIVGAEIKAAESGAFVAVFSKDLVQVVR